MGGRREEVFGGIAWGEWTEEGRRERVVWCGEVGYAMACDGMGWDRIGWEGMGWDGIGWDRMG